MGGLTFAGVGGNPRGFWNGEKNNFMPRIGLAYQLRPTTILRAGYGIFYDSIGINENNSIQTGFSTTTPMQVSLDSGITYRRHDGESIPERLDPAAGRRRRAVHQSRVRRSRLYGRDRKNPYNQRWSFGVQQPAARPAQGRGYLRGQPRHALSRWRAT